MSHGQDINNFIPIPGLFKRFFALNYFKVISVFAILIYCVVAPEPWQQVDGVTSGNFTVLDIEYNWNTTYQQN